MPPAPARRSAAIRTGRRSWRSRSWTGSRSPPRSPRSAQPGVQFCKPDEAKALARRCNDYAAELNATHGQALRRVRHGVDVGRAPRGRRDRLCLDTLKFCGVSLFASYDGKFLGDPKFDPVMEALNERDGVVFVHPGAHPTNKLIDLPWPGFMMEYLFDTTRAVVNLMFGGALERYPRIRFILPHAGGLVPYFSWRLSVSPMIDKRLKQMSQDEVFALLRRFWYDNALSPGEQTWGCLENVAAPEQIVFGTDWPFANVRVTAEAMKTYEALDAISPAQRAAIDRATRCGCSRSSRERDMEPKPRAPGRVFALALGLTALITPLAVHLFFPVIPAVKVALGLVRRLRLAHVQHRAVRHGVRDVVLRLAVGPLRPAAGAAVGAGAVPDRQRGLGGGADAGALVLGRLVQAIGAGCGLALVRAIARDAYRADQLVKAIAYLTMFGTLGPDGVADHRRRADRHARLAQRVRLRGAGRRRDHAHRLSACCTKRIPPPTGPKRSESVLQSYVALFSRLRFNAFVLQSGFTTGAFMVMASAAGLADDRAAASAGDRVRALLRAVPDRLLHRQLDLDAASATGFRPRPWCWSGSVLALVTVIGAGARAVARLRHAAGVLPAGLLHHHVAGHRDALRARPAPWRKFRALPAPPPASACSCRISARRCLPSSTACSPTARRMPMMHDRGAVRRRWR